MGLSDIQLRRVDVAVVLIPLELLSFHPLNPRPWSETYQARVHPEKVERLIASIGAAGYDLSEPICVRVMAGGGYQIIMGHHRFCAVRALGYLTIACTILSVGTTEVEAAMMMLARQGKSIEPWYAAEHAYTLCDMQGLKQSEYAKSTGYEVGVVNKWVMAYRVREQASMGMSLSVTAAAMIARTDKQYWVLLARLIVERNWTTRRVELAVKQLNALTVPIQHQFWLPLDLWVKKVIVDESGTLVREIHGWIEVMDRSQVMVHQLPAEIIHFETGELLQPWLMFTQLIERELGHNPTQLKIKLAAAAVIKACTQAMGTLVICMPPVCIGIEGVVVEPKCEELPSFEHQYTRVNDIEPIFVEAGELSSCVDVAIVDARELRDVDIWYNPMSFALEAGGRLIAIASSQDSYYIQSYLLGREWKLIEKLIWNMGGSDDLGECGFCQVYSEILVFSRGDPSYFGYAVLRELSKLERQTGNCLNIHTVGRSVPPLLIKLLITAYLPLDGSLYHYGAIDGVVAIVGKKLSRQVFWSSKSEVKADIELQILGG
jgi:ParB-like chromosome segregation protein Spo0J